MLFKDSLVLVDKSYSKFLSKTLNGIVRSFPEVIVMDDISRIRLVYIELENIIKSIASWKRLVIMKNYLNMKKDVHTPN